MSMKIGTSKFGQIDEDHASKTVTGAAANKWTCVPGRALHRVGIVAAAMRWTSDPQVEPCINVLQNPVESSFIVWFPML